MTTRDYAAAVSDPVSGKLDEAARSGLRGSRYPIDLRQGFGVLLPHLAELRTLGRELSVKAWVAAVERRPEDAATALMDLFPLANSLEGEPLLISQLVRIAIHGIAVDGLQTVMNLIELPDSVLAQLQDGFRQALPPLKDGPFLSRAMAGEESVALSYGRTIADVGSYQTIWTNHGADTKRVPTAMMLRGVLVYIGSDLLGMDRTERMVTQRLNAASREIALEAAKTGGLPYADKLYDTTLQKMSYHAPVAYILMPGLARAYEAEWRIRTQFDLACTAMAVDRYRLAKGHLPERLEELVPAYLERVPTDPWNNTKTLSYRLKENGEFVVYSFGPNKTDQKGEEVKDNWWTNGDITFTVAPPELRNRPQVAGEASGAGV